MQKGFVQEKRGRAAQYVFVVLSFYCSYVSADATRLFYPHQCSTLGQDELKKRAKNWVSNCSNGTVYTVYRGIAP